MKRSNFLNQAGFEATAVIVALLVVGVLGFGSYKFIAMHNQAKTSTASTADASATHAVPATIKTQADLTQTAQALDADGSSLDSSLNDTSLDADLNAVL